MKKFFQNCIMLSLLAAMLCPFLLSAHAAVYDPATEGITSSYYHIDREKGFLIGVAPGTSAAHLQNACMPSGCVLSQEQPATGATISAGDQSLTVIVSGDLNGDAAVTITDMLMAKSAILGDTLTDTAAVAGDVNYDGSITITDFLQLKSNLLGLSTIQAGRPSGTAPSDPMIILSPGTAQAWKGPEGTVSYFCEGAAVSVDEGGNITGISLGSAYVYAMDADGNLLARIMVTVLEQPLTVSLSASRQTMVPGQTESISVLFNHPVSPNVSWSSSDEAVVTVSTDGILSAHAFGSASVTATLENGSSAQMAVTVAPPVESLTFDRELYKVKPGNYRHPKLTVYPADTGEEIIWTSSDPSIAQVSDDGTVYGLAYGDVTVTATGKYTGLSASCRVSVCDVRQVAITFDDGPGGNTNWLLDYLKTNNIQATFFLLGDLISKYPDTVIRQAAEGHEIGYHSFNHENQLRLTSEQIAADFNNTNAALKELTGREFTLWRSPGGNYDQRVLDCIALPHIYWSVDTRDWESRNANSIYWQIVNNTVDGSIVLMHDIYGSTVEGAIMGLNALMAAGYEFLTVSELLARDGDPAQNCVNYYYDK